MLDFRILGPLEVRDEQAAIALGGPRQRALLVALLLRAGRVVPTEQLVDELYGEEPPKTATTSLQNVDRRAPEAPRAGDPRHPGARLRPADRARAGRRAPLRAAPRRRAAGLGGRAAGASRRARSSSGAVPRWPSSRSRSGRSRRHVGSTSSGSSRSRSGSRPTSSSVTPPTSSPSSSRSSASTRCASGSGTS